MLNFVSFSSTFVWIQIFDAMKMKLWSRMKRHFVKKIRICGILFVGTVYLYYIYYYYFYYIYFIYYTYIIIIIFSIFIIIFINEIVKMKIK